MTIARRSIGAVRAGAAAIRAGLAAAIRPFTPEPGTTEGAVMLGLALVAAAFLAAGLPPLALGVPGAVLVLLGSAPTIAALRGGK